ncbi:MAG: hypothetical protein HYY16_19035 [Planctomycetes bacterium]|nr:hypothetical protein [Planctomycetota bacterium]
MLRVRLSTLFLVLGASLAGAQDIPIGNEPVKTGPHTGVSDHKPYRASWVPATSTEMLEALKSFSEFLTTRLGFNPRLDAFERFNHYVGSDSPIRPKFERNGITGFGWWGHCNGETAAATLENNPPAVTRTIDAKTFDFSQEKLQALLSEAYYEASAMVRGTRSFLSETQYTEAKKLLETPGNSGNLDSWKTWYKATFNHEAPTSYSTGDFEGLARRGITQFEDLSPGEFHRTLRTAIGKAKIPIVIETAAGYEVWNWTAWQYATDVKDTGRTTTSGLKIFDVSTTVETGAGPKTYTYELHVDGKNVIKGGQWTGSSVTNHPDFVWAAMDPRFRLNEFMAKAITNNVTLDLTETAIEDAVRDYDRAALKKLYTSIDEVMSKATPPELIAPKKMSAQIYRTTVELVKEWNGNPSLQWRYGSLESYLEAGLAERLGKGSNFGVDLYKELTELLPADHRAVDKVKDRLRKAAADPTPMNRAVKSVAKVAKQEAIGMAQFAAAYLLKEGFKAVETRDPKRMKQAALQLKDPRFWGGVALFSVAARATEFALTKLPLPGVAKGLSKAALPLAAGMAAVQVLSGRVSPKNVLIGTGAFLTAGYAVNMVADGLIYPLLFRAGPPGWLGMAAYTVVKMAVTLYLGEKLEAWAHRLLERGKPQQTALNVQPQQEGVQRKIESLAPAIP